MKRLLQVCAVAALVGVLFSCGGNTSLDNDEAVVWLTSEIVLYTPDIDICTQNFDVVISQMDITSHIKGGVTVSAAQDVTLTRWVIEPYRTDGGTTASPNWINDASVYVPAGGNASLSDWRVFPVEYFYVPPLSYLLPENGGFDPETGGRNTRQSLRLVLYGRTSGGTEIATQPISIAFNFFCSTTP